MGNRSLALRRLTASLSRNSPPEIGNLRDTRCIGVTQEAGEPPPARDFQFDFSSANQSFRIGNGKADSGIEQNVVIFEIADVTTEPAAIETKMGSERFRKTDFVIVAARRP